MLTDSRETRFLEPLQETNNPISRIALFVLDIGGQVLFRKNEAINLE